MKKLSFFDKTIFVINSLVATVTLFSYLLPFMPPKDFKVFSLLSLSLPVLLLINVVFLVYWLLRLKKQFLLPLIVLLIGYRHVRALVEFGHTPEPKAVHDISLLTYNVRVFNYTHWSKKTGLKDSIAELIKKESPDVLFFQEFWRDELSVYEDLFPYNATNYKKHPPDKKGRVPKGKYGQAIFSKHKITNSGSFDMGYSGNNILYADIKWNNETVRFYNVHLQSLSITKEIEEEDITEANKEKMARNMSRSFVAQQTQVDSLIANIKQFNGRVIIGGDFNNTAYSYIYKKLRNEFDLLDSFEEEGSGFGRTFEFRYFPMRIDFVLTDHEFEVKSHEVLKQKFSDHYPVKVVLGMHETD